MKTSLLPPNNPALAGKPAAKKVLFGGYSQYAVWPIHTRFDALCWLVADAAITDPVTGKPAIIRQADTKADAMAGLDEPDDFDPDDFDAWQDTPSLNKGDLKWLLA